MNTNAGQESKLLHPLKALGTYQETVTSELRALAEPHVHSNPGTMDLLPSDDELFSAQKITHVFHDSKPSEVEEITAIATGSTAHFPYMLGALDGLEAGQKELSRINEDLSMGNNLIVATNHGDLRDVAEVLSAFHVGLIRSGIESGRPADFTTILMLSKMVTHLSIYGQTAVEILGNVCDRQYFSFPQTSSIKKSGISERIVRAYNNAVKEILQHQLAQEDEGILFGMAPSGTTEKPIDGDPSNLRLGTVTAGTIKLAMSPRTKVVPVVVWRSGDRPVFEVLDIPRQMREEEQMHAMMGGMATRLSELVPDKTFSYSKD